MKVIEFIDMLNNLTDEEKQFNILIEYDQGNDDIIEELESFQIDRILDHIGYVIIQGK